MQVYAVDSEGKMWALDDGAKLVRCAKPIERELPWDESSLEYLRLGFNSLLYDVPDACSVVTDLQFDPPFKSGVLARPPTMTWHTYDRDLTNQWFIAYLCRLDPELWARADRRTRQVIKHCCDRAFAATSDHDEDNE